MQKNDTRQKKASKENLPALSMYSSQTSKEPPHTDTVYGRYQFFRNIVQLTSDSVNDNTFIHTTKGIPDNVTGISIKAGLNVALHKLPYRNKISCDKKEYYSLQTSVWDGM